jgi:DNA-directed RNA polymerase subunit M/transcription elongation factor TFIIS
MNYCSECGFKLDGEFKFCPNCGSKINLDAGSASESRITTSKLICKNCGEENPTENTVCFSCGVPLSVNKNKSVTRTSKKKINDEVGFDSKGSKGISNEEKVLDNKKILTISSVIIFVFIVALIASGVVDSGVTQNVSPVMDQAPVSNIDMADMEEINQLEATVTANPDDMESTLHLSHLLQDSGFYEKAITYYQKYLEKSPENADARVDMAICFYNLTDYNTAIMEMEKAIEYQPEHQIAYLNLGIVNLSAQNISDSKEWFKKTVELDPNSEAGKRAQELLNNH